ncbi:MAG: metallophosphoesterase [Sphingobium sp.]|nr:metallophosphoesterase [Sphingobium sp.]
MIRLFHVSDLHFGAEDKSALDWFAGLVAAEQPDAVIVTGDLTMRARASEFEAAGEWLQGLGRPTTVEVGNHDLPAFNLLARFLRPYRQYEALEQMIERPLDLPRVLIVPLRTTARFQWRLNWSKGAVSQRSLDRTLAAIRSRQPDDIVLVTCHHPLVEGGTRMSSRTRGGAAALAAVAGLGAEAVLSGHVHDPFDIAYEAGDRTIRLIGAGTLSERLRSTRPSFNSLTIDDQGLEVIVRTMT